jgi:NADH:ubiquinone oxidoreductase subunit 5 (subunit L)/multisubunit Na+/H+ antiporter MnhA subunit/multisubunit Na+/H+ antiporter MnhB subunit
VNPAAIWISLAIVAPALLAALALAFARDGRAVAWSATAGSLFGAVVGLWAAAGEVRGVAELFAWAPELGVSLAWRVEAFPLALLVLIAGIGALVLHYAGIYFGAGERAGRVLAMLALFESAMLGLVMADNLYVLFVFWELTGIASFFLISLDKKKPGAFAAAQRALVITAGGALPMLVGFVLLHATAGTASLTGLAQAALSPGVRTLALALILPGVLTKSAQAPLHVWLPGAMAAPTPISAYLHSATMVKAGIILLLFLYPILGASPLWTVLVPFGAVTCLWGSYRALGEDDVKLLMAWSTVSQLGLIVLTIGLGTDVAMRAAVMHLFAHAVFKAGLFLTIGGIDKAAGTRSLAALGGLRRANPLLFLATAILAGSMAGIPPLAGFLSKELILKKAMLLEWWVHGAAVVAIVLGSIGTVAYSSRFVFEVFTGEPRSDAAASAKRLGMAWLAAPLLLAAVTVLAGPGAGWVDRWFLEPVTASVVGHGLTDVKPLSLWYGINAALGLSLLIVGVGYLSDRLTGLRMLPVPAWIPSGARGFDAFLAGSQATGKRLSTWLAGGSPRLYYATALILGLAAALPLLAAVRPADLAGMPPAGLAVLLVLAATLAALVRARSRLAGVLLVSAAGFAVAVLYRFMNAPDLMLTQLLVEVLLTIFFALALRRLAPATPWSPEGRAWRWARPVLAGTVGLLAGALVLAGARATPPAHVRTFYLEAAPSLAKGLNAVNVILTDFRALDTLMETLVVALAALGVAGLVRGWERNGVAQEPAQAEAPSRDGLLPGMARVILPVAALLALVLLIKGHDEPGGGFVAGLALGVAAVLSRAAFGEGRTHRAGQTVALLGGLLMIGAGLGSLAFGRPMLTHAFGELVLGAGKMKWHTALIFDVGVVMVVAGGVASAAAQLWRPLAFSEPVAEALPESLPAGGPRGASAAEGTR